MTHTTLDGLFRYAEFLNFGELHVKFDPSTGLKAIVAVHNLQRGPAIGGCRLVSYKTTEAAFEDALRLGYMMSLKAAGANLNHGGAKAVVIKPKVIKNRKAFMESFARFVHELGGSYVTAVDSGTHTADMDIIQQITPYVTCTTQSGIDGDPSPQTALGVRRGIEAAVKFKMGRDDLAGLHIAIQGAGSVGYFLAQDLHARGVRMTFCDINQTALKRVVDDFGVSVVAPEHIYDVEADVFAPCALGAVLNLHTIKRLRTKIIAGSANNQLAHQRHGKLLHERGILYAPDFVINAGGLIYVAAIYDKANLEQAEQQVCDIYKTVTDIFIQSKQEKIATNAIAERIAIERLSINNKSKVTA